MPRGPLMPFYAYKSYRFLKPRKTHWRRATCEEVECKFYRDGWRFPLMGATQQQIHDATHSGRSYKLVQVSPNEQYLEFAPGQPCWNAHKHELPIEREPIYLRQCGDFRQYMGRPYQHKNIEFWIEDMQEHQDKILKIVKRG